MAQGRKYFYIQSLRLAMATLNSSNEHPNQRIQFLSSVDLDFSAPAAPESLDGTHMTSSSDKSMRTVYSTSLYSSKAAHVGFSTVCTRMSGCFSMRTSTTGRLVFVQNTSGRRTPPLSIGVPTDHLSQLSRQ